MISRLFFFGRTPELSLVELRTFAPTAELIQEAIAVVHEEVHVDGVLVTDRELIELLGGTVKIARLCQIVPSLEAEQLIKYLKGQDVSTRHTFAISGYGVSLGSIRQLASDIKSLFSGANISARFLLPREGTAVSSVAIEKERADELVLIHHGEEYIVGQTTAIQPFESWSKRDFGRPYADPKAGMLPPKIARMIVNIALGSDAKGKTLMDPFCGMGTVVQEALMRGVNAIGTDIDGETIAKSKKNISWVLHEYGLKTNARLETSDATHIDAIVGKESLDAIATEPFLGSSKIGERKITDTKSIANIIKGLEKLYIGCLKNWACILKKGSLIAIAFPSFVIGGRVYSVKKVVDTCENLGYTCKQGPLIYSRPQAIVQRNFYIFQKQ